MAAAAAAESWAAAAAAEGLACRLLAVYRTAVGTSRHTKPSRMAYGFGRSAFASRTCTGSLGAPQQARRLVHSWPLLEKCMVRARCGVLLSRPCVPLSS